MGPAGARGLREALSRVPGPSSRVVSSMDCSRAGGSCARVWGLEQHCHLGHPLPSASLGGLGAGGAEAVFPHSATPAPQSLPPYCGWSPREKGASWVATRVKRGRPCPPAHVGRACPAQQLGGTAASRRLGRPQTPGWTAPRHSVQLLATSALAYARGPSPALGPPLLCTSTLTCTVQAPQVPTQTC